MIRLRREETRLEPNFRVRTEEQAVMEDSPIGLMFAQRQTVRVTIDKSNGETLVYTRAEAHSA